MAQKIDKLLDDALAGFDDDDAGVAASSSSSAPQRAAAAAGTAPSPPTSAAAADAPSAAAATAADADEAAATAGPSSSSEPPSTTTTSRPRGVPAGLGGRGLAFDPLSGGRRGGGGGVRGGGAAAPTATTKTPLPGPSSAEAARLSDELSRLVEDWSQAMHLDAALASSSGANAATATAPTAGPSAVLRALAEQTARTVSEQDRLGAAAGAAGASGGPGGSAAAAAAAAAAADGAPAGPMAAVVDSVMRHLLSKDVLHGPMCEIRDRYPPWLERNKPPVKSQEEYARYETQHAAICALCAQYERDANDFPALMLLLQRMQACGEPPAEIVEEMSSAVAADVPGLMAGGGAGGGLGGLGALLGGGAGGAGLDALLGGGEGDCEGDDEEEGPGLEALMSQLPPELLRDLPPELKGAGCPVQ